MDGWTRFLLFGAGAALLMLAVSSQRRSPVRFARPIPFNRVGGSRSTKEAKMAHALDLPKTTHTGFSALCARVGAVTSTVAAEQALALRAADQAALPRRRLDELRAMYLRPLDQ